MRLSLTSSRERNVCRIDLMLLRKSNSYYYSSQCSYQEVIHHRRKNGRGKAFTQQILPRARQTLQSAANEWHMGKGWQKYITMGTFKQSSTEPLLNRRHLACIWLSGCKGSLCGVPQAKDAAPGGSGASASELWLVASRSASRRA